MMSNDNTITPYSINAMVQDGIQRMIREAEARGFARGRKAGIQEAIQQTLESCHTDKLRREMVGVLRRVLGSERVPEDCYEGPIPSEMENDGKGEENSTTIPPPPNHGSNHNEPLMVENSSLVANTMPSAIHGAQSNDTIGSESEKHYSTKKAPVSANRPVTIGKNHVSCQEQEVPSTEGASTTNTTKEASAPSKSLMSHNDTVAKLDRANRPSTQVANSTSTLSGPSENVWFNKKIHRILDDLKHISDTPYKENASAEVGEPCFQHLFEKILVQQKGSRPRSRFLDVPQETKDVFQQHAQNVVRTYFQIRHSGTPYSDGWKNGSFANGTQCDPLPTEMLVLLLQASRFPNCETAVLRRIVQELDVCRIFHKALAHWYRAKDIGADEFPLFRQQKSKMMDILTMLQSHSRGAIKKKSFRGSIKKSHLLCILFVTRTYQCLETFQFCRFQLDGTLRTKVYQCLGILHNAIQTSLEKAPSTTDRRPEWAQSSTSNAATLTSNSSSNQRIPRVSDVLPLGQDSNTVASTDKATISSDDDEMLALNVVGAGGQTSPNTNTGALSRNDSNTRAVPRVSDVMLPAQDSSPFNQNDTFNQGETSSPSYSSPNVTRVLMPSPCWGMSPAYPVIYFAKKREHGDETMEERGGHLSSVSLDLSTDQEIDEGALKKRQRRSKEV